MVITAATTEQFDAFLALYAYTVPVEDRPRLLALSLSFLSTISICQEGATDTAQCFIAYAMSAAGGGFNPAAISDGKVLTKKGLGRNAIVKEWDVNDQLIGTDAVSMLKRVPMAYNILKPLLCTGVGTGNTGTVGNFEVYR